MNIPLALHGMILAAPGVSDMFGRYDFGEGPKPSLWRTPRHPDGKASVFPSGRIVVTGGSSSGSWDMDFPVVTGNIVLTDNSGFNPDRLIVLSWAVRAAIHRRQLNRHLDEGATGWCFCGVPTLSSTETNGGVTATGFNSSTLPFTVNITRSIP